MPSVHCSGRQCLASGCNTIQLVFVYLCICVFVFKFGEDTILKHPSEEELAGRALDWRQWSGSVSRGLGSRQEGSSGLSIF